MATGNGPVGENGVCQADKIILKGQFYEIVMAFYHMKRCFRPKQLTANWF